MKYQLTKDKFLSVNEFEQLDSLLDRVKDRDAALIKLARVTGARASEILSITREDVNFDEKAIYIRGLKDGRDRQIPIKPETFDWVIKYIPFNISYQRLDQIWAKWKPNRKKFHALRHTFAVELYKKHKDIKLVQLALGHRSINTTMVYVDYVYSQEELRRLVL